MGSTFVESVTASLVREYLSKKGLKMTLQMMDEEMPRDQDSISNRNQLRKALQIDKIMNKNKESDNPLQAMLEVMSKSFIDKAQARAMARPETSLSMYPETVVDRGSYYLNNNEDETNDRLSSSSGSANSRLRSSTGSHGDSTEPPTRLTHKSKKHKDSCTGADLVIDDDVEGETMLGDGRAGILAAQKAAQERLRPQSRTKMRGMSGPISASNDDRDKRNRLGRAKPSPRPMSSRRKPEPELDIPMYTPTTNIAQQGEYGDERVPPTSLTRDEPQVTSRLRSDQSRKDIHDSPSKTSDPIQDVLGVKNDTQRRPLTSRFSRLSSKEDNEEEHEDSDNRTSPSGSDSSQDKDTNQVKPIDRARSSLKSAGWRQKDDMRAQYGVSKSCVVSEITAKPVNFLDAVNNTKPKMTKVGDLEFGDVDDLDVDVAKLDLRPNKPLISQSITDSRPIDIQTAMELKKVCLGSPAMSFNDEWVEQAFTFCDLPPLSYGIVQKKGGPCGLLAAVQACMLQQLLFCLKRDKREGMIKPNLEVHPDFRTEALAMGLADILWRAGEEERAIVAIPSGNSIFTGSGRYRPDRLTETLMLNNFKTYQDLSNFLKDHIHLFEEDKQPGVVLTLYSVVLSRGIENVRSDMDESEGKLMGQHNYCTQEMVNLLLTGQAVSNTFNDYMMLDAMKLRGIAKRSSVGFLSLFEHYKSCEVGTYYKTPRYPIWVVCSESHFSVLFCLRKELISDWKVERRFDLHYYDGLANQDEPIRLTVVTSNKSYRPPSDEDLIPPLELCIRTKWGEAEVDWNGTEPLL